MKHINPIGSLFGFLLTILLFVGLGFSLWVNRGLAFNPGPVTEINRDGLQLNGFGSHAEFEKKCGTCHEPLKTNLAEKCMECHNNVAQQVQSSQGVHSKIENWDGCAACHPDHRGRLFDPTMAAYSLFDHSKTRFSLNWHQENYDTTSIKCNACHDDENFSPVNIQNCLDCHGNHDGTFAQEHVTNFGSNCLDCHDGLDRMQDFNHANTGFALEYQHAQISCTDCHTSESLLETPGECKDCHEEPTIHKGLFDQACNSCHTPEDWDKATIDRKPFSHFETAGFSLEKHQLDYSNQAINCTTCHPDTLDNFDVQVCSNCHTSADQAFMTDHLEKFSYECMSCHDGVDRLSDFDHANFFPLEGIHASIQCTDCHAEKAFRGTPTECWQCHTEPEIHAGVFGLECGACHSAEAWSPAELKEHTFPLTHGVQDQTTQLNCDACHESNYIQYTCYNCHDHKPDEIKQEHLSKGITEQEIPDCVKCHPDGVVLEDGNDD